MSLPGTPSHAERAKVSFAGEATSVGAARRYTKDRLTEWGVTGQSVAAGLIVSELASNAVRHAHSPFQLELSHTADAVRITVSDASVAPPLVRESRPGADSGFGLQIVAKLAADWGFELGDAGKKVWAHLVSAELAQPPPPTISAKPRTRRGSDCLPPI
jgi:anti-sigma regulatory factor (Ser/Thr protein kinase)